MFARSSQLSPNSFRRNGVIAFRAPCVADYHSRDVAFVNIGRDLLLRSWLVRDEDYRDDPESEFRAGNYGFPIRNPTQFLAKSRHFVQSDEIHNCLFMNNLYP